MENGIRYYTLYSIVSHHNAMRPVVDRPTNASNTSLVCVFTAPLCVPVIHDALLVLRVCSGTGLTGQSQPR